MSLLEKVLGHTDAHAVEVKARAKVRIVCMMPTGTPCWHPPPLLTGGILVSAAGLCPPLVIVEAQRVGHRKSKVESFSQVGKWAKAVATATGLGCLGCAVCVLCFCPNSKLWCVAWRGVVVKG